MATRKRATKRKRVAKTTNPAPVTARRTKGGVVVSVKVKDLKTAKKVARRIGAR
jgi:uncharacterized lipoprotein YajG